MKCHFLQDEVCGQASRMAGAPVETTEKACSVCLKQATRLNHVTASLALSKVPRPIPEKKKYLTQLLKVINPWPEGPGTELKKLIAWFHVSDGDSCKCNDRILKMNRWGPDQCEKNMDTVIRWLRHSAATHGIPFYEIGVRLLVKKAISKARDRKRSDG